MNILIYVLLFLVVLIGIGAVALCYRFLIPRCCNCFRKLTEYIANRLMYNSVIRMFLEGYFLMCISAIYQVGNTDFNSKEGIVNFTIAVLTLIVLVVFPILALKCLLKNKSELGKTTMMNKYGSLYQNIDPTRSIALRFTTYFCARRLVFAILICNVSSSLVL